MKTTKKNPKLNVKLLRRIQKHILEEPNRFQMSRPLIKVASQEEWEWDRTNDSSVEMPPCGTAACIAGWAVILSKNESVRNISAQASLLLGVQDTMFWTTHTLFYAPNWPKPFARQYANAKSPKTRAKIACARIDHLIKSGE